MMDRHLDQILMCSLYIMSRVSEQSAFVFQRLSVCCGRFQTRFRSGSIAHVFYLRAVWIFYYIFFSITSLICVLWTPRS